MPHPLADHLAEQHPTDPPPATPSSTDTNRMSRRRFLRRSAEQSSAAVGLSLLSRMGLAASGVGAAGLATGCGAETIAPTVVPLFSSDRVIVAGRRQRIPLALVKPAADTEGTVALPPDDGSIEVRVLKDGDEIDRVSVTGHVVDHDHVGEPDPDHQHANLFRYYPLRTTLPEPGIYDLEIESEGTQIDMPIQAFDAEQVDLPLVGDPFPSLLTPTETSPQTIDQLCTRFEPCPFHQISADQAMAEERPLALLVATPAYCATAYCGPVLDTLLESVGDRDRAGTLSDLAVVHIEVYANPDEVGGDYLDPAIELAPTVIDLRLEFEPSLFLVDRRGILIERIDNVFDRAEVDDALEQLMSSN